MIPQKHLRGRLHRATADYENRSGSVTVEPAFCQINPNEQGSTYTVRMSPNSQTPNKVCKTDLAAYR